MPSKFGGIEIQTPAQSRFGGIPVGAPEIPEEETSQSILGDLESAFRKIPGAPELSEFAAAINRPVLEMVDLLGTDTVNALLSLGGSEKRLPGLVESIPGTKGEFIEPGLKRDIIRAAGETVPLAAGGGAAIRQAASKLPALAPGGEAVGAGVLRQAAQTTAAEDVTLGALSGAGAVAGEEVGGQPGALVGSMVAPLAPAAALITARQAGGKFLIEAAPSVEQIKTKARGIYKAIDDQGAVISPKSFTGLVKSINTTTRKAGFDRDIHPKANAVLRRFNEDIGNAPTTSEMDTLRRVAQSAAASTEPDEARIGSLIINKIDDYMDDLKPADFFLEGDGQNIGRQYKDARELWSRAKKSETIQEAITKAQDQATGFENGLRTQFRRILNNKRLSRGFSADEKKSMRQVVQGTKAANTAKLLGKFGISENQATSMLGMSVGAAGGAAAFGAPGAVAVPLMGQVSKNLAQRLTRNNAELADSIVRSGKDGKKIARLYMSSVPKSQRNPQDLAQILLNRNADLTALSNSKNKLINDAAFFAGSAKVLEDEE